MLECKNISLEISGKQILTDVAYNFEAGKFYSIIGPNGSGKTTWLKCLSGVIPNFTGEVLYHKKSVKNYSIGELAKIRAFHSQNTNFSFSYKVSQILEFSRHPYNNGKTTSQDFNIINEVTSLTNLGCFLNRDFNTLSGGEKQKILFAKTLIQVWDQENPIIFLDEPEASLDIKNQIEILNLAKDLASKNNFCVIAILHNLNLVNLFADEVIMLKNGCIYQSGLTSNVLNNNYISDLFDIEEKFFNII